MTATTEHPDRPFSGGYWEERNRRRREEYAKNPELREKLREEARQVYADKTAGGNRSALAQARIDYFEDLDLSAMAVERKVAGLSDPLPCFTIDEAAAVLSMTPKQLSKWMSDGRIPVPIFRTVPTPEKKVPVPVFSQREMEAVISALYDHAFVFAYYRADHHETRDRIHNDVAEARKVYGL